MKDLSLHILDLVQNSIRAKASCVEINITEDPFKNVLRIRISDDGTGMSVEQAEQAPNPFYTTRTTRKVGLGLPLFRQNAERTGGTFELHSEAGRGTVVEATFGLSHLDRPPLGDLPEMIALLAAGHPEQDLVYTHTTPTGMYRFSSREVREELGDISLQEPEIFDAIREMVQSNLEEINIVD